MDARNPHGVSPPPPFSSPQTFTQTFSSSEAYSAAGIDLLDLMLTHFDPVAHYGQHQRHGREYFFYCDACGSDRMSMNADPGSFFYGVYHCWACHRKGHIKFELERNQRHALEGRPPRIERALDWELIHRVYGFVDQSCRLSAGHERYLRGRGLDPGILAAKSTDGLTSKLRRAFTESELCAAGLAGRHEDSGKFYWCTVVRERRILVPYYSDDGATVTYLRSYNYDPRFPRGMKGPAGVPAGAFVFGTWLRPASAALRPADAKPVIVTEGEFKCAAALQAGYATLATPGLQTSLPAIVEVVERRGIRSVWIGFDRQRREPGIGDPEADAARRLVDLLRFKPVDVRVIRLPLAPCKTALDESDERKMDLDDYLLCYGPAAFHHLVAQAVPASLAFP
jgi:hypothetical protein